MNRAEKVRRAPFVSGDLLLGHGSASGVLLVRYGIPRLRSESTMSQKDIQRCISIGNCAPHLA